MWISPSRKRGKALQNPITPKGQRGFSLIEILIVVAILGILAVIAIPQYAQYRTSAFNSAAKSELKNVHTALEGYYHTGNNVYPDTSSIDSDLEFDSSDKVVISYGDPAGDNRTYAACAYHKVGDKYYTLNSSLRSIAEYDCTAAKCDGCDYPSGSNPGNSQSSDDI